MKPRTPVNWGRAVPALVVIAFTGFGIGEPLAEVLQAPRWACNLAGVALAIWLIKVIGDMK